MPKKDKNSFIFHLEWQEVLRDYPAEVRLEVYDAVIEYAASGSLPELEPLAKMAFAFIKKDIDHDNERRREISEIKSINGRKGAQVKQMVAKQANASECKQNKQMVANASKTSKCLQMVAKQANAFRETENEKDVSDGFPLQPFSLTSEKDKEKEKKESTPYGVLKKKAADAPFSLPLPMENPSGNTEEKPNPDLINSEDTLPPGSAPPPSPKRNVFVKPTLEQVKAYFSEKGFKSDPEHFYDHFESNGWKVGGRGAMKDWKAAVRNWERNDGKYANYGREKQQRFGATPPDDFAGKGSTKL